MMSNRKLYLIVAGVTLLLTVSLGRVAQQHQMWREFWVNVFVLGLTAIITCRLLTRRE